MSIRIIDVPEVENVENIDTLFVKDSGDIKQVDKQEFIDSLPTGETYTAGDGIKIENNVISLDVADGDKEEY